MRYGDNRPKLLEMEEWSYYPVKVKMGISGMHTFYAP